MACSASTCQSTCYSDQPDQQHSTSTASTNKTNRNIISNGLCLKCKTNPPISAAAADSQFCADCFRANLFGKFRFAVTSNAMISPSDNVLVAFSGGPSSRVALEFVHEMHSKAQKNFDACRDRSLPVFGVGVAFVDETSVYSAPSDEEDRAVQDIASIVEKLAPPPKQLHVVPIENVFYSSECGDEGERLKKLLDAVTDPTGKEDLLLHLRMLALQKIASENGYNRLLLGSCISRIACHVLTATVKGQGYSLPADIQYVDSRWEIPVLLPLRDCLAHELNMLCRLDGLETVELIRNPGTGINGLVSSFVSLLQEENPSRECTIVRTAGKLIPFHFNRIQETDDSNVPLATRRRQKRYNLKPNECFSSESFCFICNGPLSKSDLLSLRTLEQCQTSPDALSAACCSSCRFQILPQDPLLLDQFSSVLPQQLVSRAKHDNYDSYSVLREQIQDCLLSEGEDEM
ncbi:cytoplasmic tRNA 2-thiolation protein 2 [Argentina anserina]|uniref:cytoplasmic tRNA 2-thiolation protein 2 n=1 Tax=Argentina anserina TaxID=57926 RepID=UPI0021764236|nr:cytoplasmic tRNA 2-thiolation protein 2 [Potentilla anserina]